MLLIKIIFWFIVIYYVLKLAVRFLLPFILKRLAKKFMSNMEQMQNQTSQNYKQKTEGDVTIDSGTQKKKGERYKGGDYVDYEEVKE